MTCGSNSNNSFRLPPRMRKGGGVGPMTANYSMGCSTCYGPGVRGGLCRAQSLAPGKRSMIALRSGSVRGSLHGSGRTVSISMRASTGLTGNGKRQMGAMGGLRRGEKEAGPNPTDRAKPGSKDHLLVDGRGVPLSTVSTAANVNDGPLLSRGLNSLPIVRPQPDREHPHHLCLDAAFDNAPARAVVLVERYTGHIAPKGGQAQDAVVHPGGQARRWKVERTHAWHDRFRRLVVNWEQTLTSRYAFICLANALIAYRL